MLLPLALCLASRSVPTQAEEPAPRLVVMIAVDQFLPEQLERLRDHLPGGLGRLQREGLRFTEAALPYGTTHTGPGHASFATGCLPSSHGLVANEYYDRDLRRNIYCVEDRGASAVTSAGLLEKSKYGRSPRNLRRPSFGGHLRASVPGAKIVTISAKDRAAITLAGRSGDVALWWDRGQGAGFRSTDHYGASLPPWVQSWNAGWMERTAGWRWEPTFDAEHAPPGTAADARVGEGLLGAQGPSFPYVIGQTPVSEYGLSESRQLSGAVYQSPLMDRFVFELAKRAVLEESLGADDEVDLLGLSFSACDAVGHVFGPYSVEVTDLLLRLDAELGAFFELLDERVGVGRWVAALTSDHGVLPLIETLQAQGSNARRIGPTLQRALQVHVERAVAEAFGLEESARLPFPTRGSHFTFDLDAIVAAGLDPASVRAVVAKAAEQEDWIQAAYSREQLISKAPSQDPFLQLCRNSVTPDRGYDVQIVMEPECLTYTPTWGKTGTSHGSPHIYDRRIPLIFYGPGFDPGERTGPAASQDAVPTLLELLSIPTIGPLDGSSLLHR